MDRPKLFRFGGIYFALLFLSLTPCGLLVLGKMLDVFPRRDVPTLISESVFVGILWLALFGIAIFAANAGIWASYFLRSSSGQKTELINLSSRNSVGLFFFGTILGVVVTFLLLGGFISGNLFPNLGEQTWYRVAVSLSDFAKLFVWCFVAGFSERLIPDYLDRLISTFKKQDAEERPTDEGPVAQANGRSRVTASRE